MENNNIFCSWSGGKDSTLALYYMINRGFKPKYLLTMLIEDGLRSRSHGLSLSLLKRQSLALDMPLLTSATTWQDYENNFNKQLLNFKKRNINQGVFGDIDLIEHRQWIERVCQQAGIKPYLPLWNKSRKQLLTEFLDLGFKATIIAVKDGVLAKNFLGEVLNYKLISLLEKEGIDPSGEEGEYHTVVTDGPIFLKPLKLEFKERVYSNGYWFQDVAVK